MKNLKSKEISPIPVAIAAVAIVAVAVYFFWIGPARSASEAEKKWTTDTAVQERMNAKSGDAAYKQKVQEVLAKEGRVAPISRRERD
jgi:hypothetical protein